MTQLLLPPAPPDKELSAYADELAYIGSTAEDIAQLQDCLESCLSRCHLMADTFIVASLNDYERLVRLSHSIKQLSARISEILANEKGTRYVN